MTSIVQLRKTRKWEAVCPRCNKIALSNENNNGCPNCHGTVSLYVPTNNKWESEAARLSWVHIKCDRDCGWNINSLKCPSCKATIEGKFFKEKMDAITWAQLIIGVAIMILIFYFLMQGFG